MIVHTYENGKRVVKNIDFGFAAGEDEMPQVSCEELLEMRRGENAAMIAGLKERLAESDYKALKYAEGWLTANEYATVRAERQALRDEINRLEALTDEEMLKMIENNV